MTVCSVSNNKYFRSGFTFGKNFRSGFKPECDVTKHFQKVQRTENICILIYNKQKCDRRHALCKVAAAAKVARSARNVDPMSLN